VIKPKEQLSKGSALLAGEEKRRSQRVIIRVPLTLLKTQDGHTAKISCYTVAVNVHGAMIVSPRNIDEDTKLEMLNDRTNETIGCRVTRAPRESAEGFLIPLEFTSPAPNFWQISFPPSNWKALDG
jgi:hypothetical protein